jgi:hypothetical protein
LTLLVEKGVLKSFDTKGAGSYFELWIADTDSQRTKSGTFARHTEANLAKEPALCQRTGNTLRFDTDPHYSRLRRRANVQQGVCQNTGWRKLSSAFCNSIVLYIGLDIISLAFCCYLHHQFFNHHRYRADRILIPVLRQALAVVGNLIKLLK